MVAVSVCVLVQTRVWKVFAHNFPTRMTTIQVESECLHSCVRARDREVGDTANSRKRWVSFPLTKALQATWKVWGFCCRTVFARGVILKQCRHDTIIEYELVWITHPKGQVWRLGHIWLFRAPNTQHVASSYIFSLPTVNFVKFNERSVSAIFLGSCIFHFILIHFCWLKSIVIILKTSLCANQIEEKIEI